MNIIKEIELSHEVFNNYEREDNTIEIFRFEAPSGYMVISRKNSIFHITLSAEELITDFDELDKILTPYIKGHVYFVFDEVLTTVTTYLESKEFIYWYGMYGMSMKRKPVDIEVGTIIPYNNEVERYCDIIGKCFEPMRKRHDFKPYDWYQANQLEATKEFESASVKGWFYGYRLNGEIIGAAIAEDNEIDILAITDKLQKNGYGRQLLRGVLKDMFKKHETIKISVVESNQHVLKLYESEGFSIDSHKKMYKNY